MIVGLHRFQLRWPMMRRRVGRPLARWSFLHSELHKGCDLRNARLHLSHSKKAALIWNHLLYYLYTPFLAELNGLS